MPLLSPDSKDWLFCFSYNTLYVRVHVCLFPSNTALECEHGFIDTEVLRSLCVCTAPQQTKSRAPPGTSTLWWYR